MFVDPLASKLAGPEGLHPPMGDWIRVPRKRFGDDFITEHYTKPRGVRQLVLLGAGMDARAYRLRLPELKVFEVRISEQHTNIKKETCGWTLANCLVSLRYLGTKMVHHCTHMFGVANVRIHQTLSCWHHGNSICSWICMGEPVQSPIFC